MDDQLELLAKVETYVGAAFVAFYGFERFRKPPSEPGPRQRAYPSRATTTAASYYTAVILYCAIGVSVYAGLLFSPSLLEKIRILVPQLGDAVPAALQRSPSVVVALLLTVLLPRVPVLASLDEFTRTRLQHMAAIPYEVRRLAVELKRATFRPAGEEEYAEMLPGLLAQGYDEVDVRYATGDTLLARWFRVETLMHRLEAWEADGGLRDYVADCRGELEALRERREDLAAKVRRAGELGRGPDGQVPDERMLATLNAYREDVAAALDGLLRDLHDAISRAVLLGEYTEQRRIRRLATLGFAMQPLAGGRVSLNSLMLLFTAGSVLFLFFFNVMPSRRPEETPVDMLLRSVMIAAIYCVSIWCALGPKSHWLGARRRPGEARPWFAYLVSALLASVAGAAVNLAVKMLYHASFEKAWPRFQESLPWTLMTFAVAYTVAALADDEPADFAAVGLGKVPLWVVEAEIMLVVMVPVSLLVYHFLLDTTVITRIPSLNQVLLLTVIVSLSIGALVPSWYRQAPSAMAAPRLTSLATARP
jgi:hypothetical protein